MPFMGLRLTASVIYCPGDTILPLQGDRKALSPPAQPQIRQHCSGSTAKAADAGRRGEAGGYGGSSRKPAWGLWGRQGRGNIVSGSTINGGSASSGGKARRKGSRSSIIIHERGANEYG